jgi:hypothetical protein
MVAIITLLQYGYLIVSIVVQKEWVSLKFGLADNYVEHSQNILKVYGMNLSAHLHYGETMLRSLKTIFQHLFNLWN